MSAGSILAVFFAGAVLVGTLGIIRPRVLASNLAVSVAGTGISLAFFAMLAVLAWLLLPSGGGVVTLGTFYTGAFIALHVQSGAVWVGLIAIAVMAAGFWLPANRSTVDRGEPGARGWDRATGLAAVALASVAGNLVTMFPAVALAAYSAHRELTSQDQRFSLRAHMARVVTVVGAVLLLSSTVELYVQHGTSNFAAIPVGAATSGIAIPWLLAALFLLVAPVVSVSAGGPVARWSWLTLPSVGLLLLNALVVTEGAALPADVSLPAALCGGALLLLWLWLGTCTRWIRYRIPLLYLALLGLATVDFAVGSQSAWGVLAIVLCLLFFVAIFFFFLGAVLGTERKPATGALLCACVVVGCGFLCGMLSMSVLAGWSVWAAPAVALVLGTTSVLIYRATSDLSIQLPLHLRGGVTAPKLAAALLLLCLSLIPLLFPALLAGTAWQLMSFGTAPSQVTPQALVAVGGGWAGAYVFAAAILLWVGGSAGLIALFSGAPQDAKLATPPVSHRAQGPIGASSVSDASSRKWALRYLFFARRQIRRFGKQADALEVFLVDQPRLAAVVLGSIACLLLFH